MPPMVRSAAAARPPAVLSDWDSIIESRTGLADSGGRRSQRPAASSEATEPTAASAQHQDRAVRPERRSGGSGTQQQANGRSGSPSSSAMVKARRDMERQLRHAMDRRAPSRGRGSPSPDRDSQSVSLCWRSVCRRERNSASAATATRCGVLQRREKCDYLIVNRTGSVWHS